MRVASALHASIPDTMIALGFKPVKYRDAEEALSFHRPPYTSDIISKPGTHAVRGGAKSVYFDEAAYIEKFDILWQAGVPATIRGDNRITVISTPSGQSGKYYDLATKLDEYPEFSRHIIPWWESRFMVREGALEDAIALAPTMGTQERVMMFGNEKLINKVWKTMDVMAFQTEMECMFIDENEAFFPWELVTSAADDTIINTRASLEGLNDKHEYSIGVDLAKKRDETVFTVVEHWTEDDANKMRVVYIERHAGVPYDAQYELLTSLARLTRARRISIDETGVGQIFVERAKREGFGTLAHVEGITFTHNKKEAWATKFKADMQNGNIKYPRERATLDQIHGIRRKKSETGFYRFTGEHDDIFWSMCLGIYGEGYAPVRFTLLGGSR